MKKVEEVKKEQRESSAQLTKAQEFLNTIRGQYIISQALGHAIKRLEAVVIPHEREVSNISDMKFLRDNLFPMWIEDPFKGMNRADVCNDIRSMAADGLSVKEIASTLSIQEDIVEQIQGQ